MGTSYFSFIKTDMVSNSWTEDITPSIILLFIRTGAFSGGGGASGLMGRFGFSVK